MRCSTTDVTSQSLFHIRTHALPTLTRENMYVTMWPPTKWPPAASDMAAYRPYVTAVSLVI